MSRLKYHAAIFAAAAVLAGCNYVDDTLSSVFTVEEASEPEETVKTPPAPGEEDQQPALSPTPPSPEPAPAVAGTPPAPGTTAAEPMPVTPGEPTGTTAGKKAVELRKELERLRGSVAGRNGVIQKIRDETVENAQRYHSTVAAINARLQVGTTPGNQVLVQQWNTAQIQLNRTAENIDQMNAVAGEIASDSATAKSLLKTTRATSELTGAVDEDHRQLAALEDDLNRMWVLIDRLLRKVNGDVGRQISYLGYERKSLANLSFAIKSGEPVAVSLTNRALAKAAEPAAGGSGRVGPAQAARRPLVVIRFDRADVNYEQALYKAVSRALERRPGAVFDLVAVAPKQGAPSQLALSSKSARRNAEKVWRSLASMGLPDNRMTLSATTREDAKTSEVRIYVR